MMKLLGILKYPIVRHILAGVVIIFVFYRFSISPLREQIVQLHEQINKDRVLIEKLSVKDTYHIENKVDVKKAKDGSNIHLIPENSMQVVNSMDTIVKRKKVKRTWAGRVLKKIGDIFK